MQKGDDATSPEGGEKMLGGGGDIMSPGGTSYMMHGEGDHQHHAGSEATGGGARQEGQDGGSQHVKTQGRLIEHVITSVADMKLGSSSI